MARVTVEDCILKVPNRFDLVMVAAQRARSISAGAALTIERDNDKNPVVALREIAEETVDLKELETSLVKDQQKHVEMDEPEEDQMDLIAIQEDMTSEAAEPAEKAEIDEDALSVEEKEAPEEGAEGAEGEPASDGGEEDAAAEDPGF